MSHSIFFIDTSSDFLRLMEELLADEGYDIYGREHLGREPRPDLLIIDMVFHQEERGFQLLEELKLDPITTGIPIILCSAAEREIKEMEDYLITQRVRVLLKPFDFPALLKAVQDMLNSSPPTRQSA